MSSVLYACSGKSSEPYGGSTSHGTICERHYTKRLVQPVVVHVSGNGLSESSAPRMMWTLARYTHESSCGITVIIIVLHPAWMHDGCVTRTFRWLLL